jgi:hypothetical protein
MRHHVVLRLRSGVVPELENVGDDADDLVRPLRVRTVSSRCRATPRTRKRLATFAHAIISTHTTAAPRTRSDGRTRDVISATTPRT